MIIEDLKCIIEVLDRKKKIKLNLKLIEASFRLPAKVQFSTTIQINVMVLNSGVERTLRKENLFREDQYMTVGEMKD
jgi:hypothetical protein